MKRCGFDLDCRYHAIIDPIWNYLFWGFWVVVGVVALVVVLFLLGQVRSAFGWRGVATALVGLSGVGIFILGFLQGRGSVAVKQATGGTRSLTRDQVMDLQRALAARHLYPGEIDGKFGAQSIAGLKSFQRQRGEKQTGKPTLEQLRDLGIYLPRQ